jgi:hypothetical protein
MRRLQHLLLLTLAGVAGAARAAVAAPWDAGSGAHPFPNPQRDTQACGRRGVMSFLCDPGERGHAHARGTGVGRQVDTSSPSSCGAPAAVGSPALTAPPPTPPACPTQMAFCRTIRPTLWRASLHRSSAARRPTPRPHVAQGLRASRCGVGDADCWRRKHLGKQPSWLIGDLCLLPAGA